MQTVWDWAATLATIAGALMVAANLGTRVTGWGFVVFCVGSVAWIATGLINDQASLIVTNGVLFAVNLFGVWRWLGRQTRYETGSARAARRSRRAPVPTLFPAGALIGSTIEDDGGKSRGEVVEAMLQRDDKRLAYVVVSEGGIGGTGEVLKVLTPDQLRLDDDTVRCDLPETDWKRLPTIEGDRWPEAAPTTAATNTIRHG
jgi:hypothetical protein